MSFHIVKNTFYILICVASVTSNSLLITILLRFEHLRTTANLFVLNLAFCDIITVLFGIPFTIGVEESSSYPFGEIGCKLLMPIATGAFNSAAFTLLAIAIDRFYAIMFPMRARLQSCKVKSLVLCVLHGFSIGSVLPLAIHQRYIKGPDKDKCLEMWPEGGSRIYTLALFSIQYAVPLALIAILYSVSWNEIRKKNKVIIKMQELQQRGKCHFSRSQSWDAVMRRSESAESYPKGNGSEKVVIKSTSSYSFKSSHLEAVEEGNSREGLNSLPDDVEAANEENIPLTNLIDGEKHKNVDRAPAEISEGRKARLTIKSRWVGKHWPRNVRDQQSIDYVPNKGRYEDETAIIADTDNLDENVNSITAKYDKNQRIHRVFKKQLNCDPTCFSLCKHNLKEEFIEESDVSQETGEKIPSVSEDDRKNSSSCKGHFMYSRIPQASDISVDSANSENTQITISIPNDIAASGFKETQDVQKEAAGPAVGKQFGVSEPDKRMIDRKESDGRNMKHSISSPSLSTCTPTTKRIETVSMALRRSSNHSEVRGSKVLQIASQAKRRLSQAMASNSTENMCMASIKRMKQTRRTLRMFTCVVVIFAICMLPNQITWIWMEYKGAHLPHQLYTLFYFLTYTNSVINPWIYGAVNPSFRKAYGKVFGCCSATSTNRKFPARSSSKLSSLWLSARSSEANVSTRNCASRKSLFENSIESNQV